MCLNCLYDGAHLDQLPQSFPAKFRHGESFSIKIDLDHVSIPEKYYKIMGSIADEVLPLNESAKGTIRTPVNGEKIAVSYKDTVDGNAVVVTYYTDLKGNILKVGQKLVVPKVKD